MDHTAQSTDKSLIILALYSFDFERLLIAHYKWQDDSHPALPRWTIEDHNDPFAMMQHYMRDELDLEADIIATLESVTLRNQDEVAKVYVFTAHLLRNEPPPLREQPEKSYTYEKVDHFITIISGLYDEYTLDTRTIRASLPSFRINLDDPGCITIIYNDGLYKTGQLVTEMYGELDVCDPQEGFAAAVIKLLDNAHGSLWVDPEGEVTEVLFFQSHSIYGTMIRVLILEPIGEFEGAAVKLDVQVSFATFRQEALRALRETRHVNINSNEEWSIRKRQCIATAIEKLQAVDTRGNLP